MATTGLWVKERTGLLRRPFSAAVATQRDR